MRKSARAAAAAGHAVGRRRLLFSAAGLETRARPVYVRGAGQAPVRRRRPDGEEQDTFESLSGAAIDAALASAGLEREEITQVVVGNMLSPVLQRQSQLASLITSRNSLDLCDTMTIDAACGSGGSAVRAGMASVMSGMHRNVLVLGVEILTGAGVSSSEVTSALAQASDMKHEGGKGETFVSLNDRLMQLYLKEYPNMDRSDFFYFSQNAHRNAQHNANAALQSAITMDDYAGSRLLAKEVNLYDACPTANGAAAIVLSSDGHIDDHVRLAGSDTRTDQIHLDERPQPLSMAALAQSTSEALAQAGCESIRDVDIYECHDAYSIMSCLSLEVCGAAPAGQAAARARAGEFAVDGGWLPISTFGGLKARGHPVGATGVYQMAELYEQLHGIAPPEIQVAGNPRVGLTNSFGGAATTVATHVLTRG